MSDSCSTTHLYTGDEYDPETGLDHTLFRKYSWQISRWTTPDPAGLAAVDPTNPQSWNQYAYVLNNPMNLIDPSGMNSASSGCGGLKGKTLFNCLSNLGNQNSQSCLDINSGISVPCNLFNLNLDEFDLVFPSACGTEGCQSFIDPDGLGLLLLNNGGSGGPTGNGCGGSQSKETKTIVGGSLTTNKPTISTGAAIGGYFGGPPGAFLGGLIGSFFGIGISASWVPSTNSVYVGPTVAAGITPGGASGVQFTGTAVPSPQSPNSIANGPSFSVTYQPWPTAGSIVTKSPNSGPPVVGYSTGSRTQFSAAASYGICVHNCGCP